MASTFNIKGTSYSSFQIGKEGVTLYQGITPPPSTGNFVKGDIYLQRGDTLTEWYYDGITWVNQTAIPIGGNPIGTIISFSGATIPDSYLLCDGSTFDKTIFPDLFMFLGTNKLPDLRGMFLRGLDTTGKIDSYTGTRQLLSFEEGTYVPVTVNGAVASISCLTGTTGPNTQNNNTMAGVGLDPSVDQSGSYAASWQQPGGTYWQQNVGPGGWSGNGAAVGNVSRPKNIAVNYLIKARITENGKDGDFVPVRATKAVKVTSNGNLTFDTFNMTGNIVGNKGGTLPQVLGMSGNVVMQTFVATGPSGSSSIVTFPNAFSPGTTPLVFVMASTEPGPGFGRGAQLVEDGNGNVLINNTGFTFQSPVYTGTGVGLSGLPYKVQVLAIGVM